jgi:outer membrane lipoprotein carrier protein
VARDLGRCRRAGGLSAFRNDGQAGRRASGREAGSCASGRRAGHRGFHLQADLQAERQAGQAFQAGARVSGCQAGHRGSGRDAVVIAPVINPRGPAARGRDRPRPPRPTPPTPAPAPPGPTPPPRAPPATPSSSPPSSPPAAAAAATVTASAEAEAVWQAYEKRWSETADYAAGFRQTIEVPDIGSKVESAGRFYFAKPGLVRWEYTEGPPQTVVGDGTWIWLYQPDLQQVYKIPYAKAFGRGGLVELLAGREGVSERYHASLERPDDATVRILLKSKVEGGGDLEVTLTADTFDLRAVTVHDSAGSTTRMTFAEPLRNRGGDRDRFTFTPPPAVDIISDNEAGF